MIQYCTLLKSNQYAINQSVQVNSIPQPLQLWQTPEAHDGRVECWRAVGLYEESECH